MSGKKSKSSNKPQKKLSARILVLLIVAVMFLGIIILPFI